MTTGLDQPWRAPRPYESPVILASDELRLGPFCAIVICAALGLHWLLVYANTHLTAISDTHLIGAEMAIIATACLLIGAKARLSFLGVLFAVVAYLSLVWLIRGAVDAKTARDLLIPVIFYELGRTRGSFKLADKLVIGSAIFILIVAVIELMFRQAYGETFNILQYYIARGEAPPEAATFYGNNFNVNGQRPGGIGRSLLPFLGPNRAASIFVEPVSLGNFGVIVWGWVLLRPSSGWAKAALLLLPATLIVLADSRFGATMVIVVTLVWALHRIQIVRIAAPALPIVVLAGLACLWSYYGNAGLGDNMIGRLVYSGRYVFSMSAEEWLGVYPTVKRAFDSGYADVIRNAGIVGVGAAWMFLAASFRNEQQQFLKMFIIVYYSMILCISLSVFSIKTAALLWFALGCLGALPSLQPKGARAEA